MPIENPAHVATFDRGQASGRTQALDDAMDRGAEERRLVREAMIERALGDLRADGNRSDACRAIAMGQKLIGGDVEDALPELH